MTQDEWEKPYLEPHGSSVGELGRAPVQRDLGGRPQGRPESTCLVSCGLVARLLFCALF